MVGADLTTITVGETIEVGEAGARERQGSFRAALFVVREHPKHLHGPLLLENLVDEPPTGRHQPGPFAQREIGVFVPLRIDSRIPGMERR